jgi:hypothetical protein
VCGLFEWNRISASLSSFAYTFVIYVLLLEIQKSWGEGLDSVNQLNPTTFLCLFQTRIYKVLYVMVFFVCSVSWVRGDCSMSWGKRWLFSELSERLLFSELSERWLLSELRWEVIVQWVEMRGDCSVSWVRGYCSVSSGERWLFSELRW